MLGLGLMHRVRFGVMQLDWGIWNYRVRVKDFKHFNFHLGLNSGAMRVCLGVGFQLRLRL